MPLMIPVHRKNFGRAIANRARRKSPIRPRPGNRIPPRAPKFPPRRPRQRPPANWHPGPRRNLRPVRSRPSRRMRPRARPAHRTPRPPAIPGRSRPPLTWVRWRVRARARARPFRNRINRWPWMTRRRTGKQRKKSQTLSRLLKRVFVPRRKRVTAKPLAYPVLNTLCLCKRPKKRTNFPVPRSKICPEVPRLLPGRCRTRSPDRRMPRRSRTNPTFPRRLRTFPARALRRRAFRRRRLARNGPRRRVRWSGPMT